MKKIVVVSVITLMVIMMQAVVIDKVKLANGHIIAYSQGARHEINAQEYGNAINNARSNNDHGRWISFLIGNRIFTMSSPTSEWACKRLNVC
jgi:hypothetical protein